jgi:hypothetical protein
MGLLLGHVDKGNNWYSNIVSPIGRDIDVFAASSTRHSSMLQAGYTLVAQGKTRVAVAAEVLLGLLCSYIAHAPHISQEACASSSISTAVDCATAAMFVAQSSSSSVMKKSWGFVSLAADFIYHVTPTGAHLKDDSCRVPVGVKALALQHGMAASIVPGAYSRLQRMDIEVGGRSLPPLCCCFVLMFDRQ